MQHDGTDAAHDSDGVFVEGFALRGLCPVYLHILHVVHPIRILHARLTASIERLDLCSRLRQGRVCSSHCACMVLPIEGEAGCRKYGQPRVSVIVNRCEAKKNCTWCCCRLQNGTVRMMVSDMMHMAGEASMMTVAVVMRMNETYMTATWILCFLRIMYKTKMPMKPRKRRAPTMAPAIAPAGSSL